MAIIPKYTQQRSIPGTTGQQMAPLSIVGSSPLKTIGDAGMAISGVLSEASQRIQGREETLDRARKFDQFQTDVATEWQRVQDQEDVSSPKTLQAFNTFVANKRRQLMGEHTGSAGSRAKLEAQFGNVSGVYERTAISAMRNGQIDALKKSYGDRLNPIIAGVTDGSITVESAMQRINDISQDLGGSDEDGWNLPRSMAFDMHDAAQSAVAIASIDRHLGVGNFRKAQLEFDRHPEFAKILTTEQMQKIVKRIGEQRTAYQIADQQAMRNRDMKAQDLGFGSWGEVPQSWKLAIATNQPIPGMEKFTPMTDAGKAIADRNALVRFYGEDSKTVKQFDALNASSGAQKMASDIGKLHADLEKLAAAGKGPGDQAYDAIKNVINEKNPEYTRALELKNKFPVAKVALDTFTRQAESMRDNAKRAIMLWTGTNKWEDAQKRVDDINAGNVPFYETKYAVGTTGIGMQAALLSSGSDINEIKSILTRIGGKQMLNALAALKAASPTGGSGMGALNETEGKALMFQEGALDIMAPETTIKTLVDLVANTDSAIARQKAAFETSFSVLPQNGDRGQQVTAPQGKAGAPGPKRYDLNGNPIGG